MVGEEDIKKNEVDWYRRRQIIDLIKCKYEYECEFITIEGAYHGVLYILDVNKSPFIYFRSQDLEVDKFEYKFMEHTFCTPKENLTEGQKELFIKSADICEIVLKNFMLVPSAFEIYDYTNNKSYFFTLFDPERRKDLFSKFREFRLAVIEDCRRHFKDMKYQDRWSKGKISTFDYLMLINKYSSRSFNDTAQYPIMPWVGPCGADEFSELNNAQSSPTRRNNDNTNNEESNFSKHEIDLMNKGIVRNLTKNSGM